MKITNSLRQQFLTQFTGKKVKREEIENFLEPYIEFDIEVLCRQALAREAQKFIASFKDDRQVRECWSSEVDGQTAFSFIGRIYEREDLPILYGIQKKLCKQMEGIKRGKEKVEARIWMIKNQLVLHVLPTNDLSCSISPEH